MNCTEYLKYEFTEKELKDLARELARENTAMAESEEEKKSVVASFTERIADAKMKISKLSRYINNGYDYRNIECAVVMNSPRAGVKEVVRIDTGEIVKTINMTDTEKQESLPFEVPPETPSALFTAIQEVLKQAEDVSGAHQEIEDIPPF